MPRLTEQQQRAVESIDMNVLVSAGAGSGKTMVLVERFLEVLRNDPEASVPDIIAVTFTRKAAEEMRSRLKARLRELTHASEGEEKQRWSKMLAEVDRARIGTIHSLCESILRAYPADAGVDPQFELLDELLRAEMLNEAIEHALQNLIAEPTPEQEQLLDYPVESIRSWIQEQLKSIPQYKSARANLGESPADLQRFAATLLSERQKQSLAQLRADKSVSRLIDYLENTPFSDPESPVEKKRAALVSAFRQAFAAVDENFASGRAKSAGETLSSVSELPSLGNAGGAKAKELRHAIKEAQQIAVSFVEETPPDLTEADDRAFIILWELLKIIDTAVAAYEKAKQENQKVDYNDLITKTFELICSETSTARKHFGDRVRAILVDEFQDTNHTQAKLLSSLCGSAARLFLIGDDKQSIYKFQGADVSTFNSWKSLIDKQDHGLEGQGLLLDLSYSFRSHPTIVDFVNRFFRFYFDNQPSGGSSHRAAHQALTASREDAHDPNRVELVVYETNGLEGAEKIDSRLLESQAIAAWIAEKVSAGTTIFDKDRGAERPLRFGDFAVLVQTNGDFAVIESALSEAEIPYVTFAGSGFLERQEILDIENMLRWLFCVEDDHALLGILRAPFFSINDGVIHRICTGSPKYIPLWNRVQKASKEAEFAMSLARPVETLQKLLQLAPAQRTSDLIRGIVARTAYDTVVLPLPNGKQKSRNVWKFATFARQYDHLPVPEFLRALQSMRELGVNNQTDAPLNAEDSVRLMTIHKSKGLEFPVVILPAMSRKIHQFSPKLLVHRDFGVAFDTSRSNDDPKPAYYRAAASFNRKMDEEEKKRLLYVAMTRARDFLAMFIDRHARSETSFRLWIKQALGVDIDTEEAPPAQLAQDEHYTIRFVEADAIADWKLRSSGFLEKTVRQEELTGLAKEIGFNLLEPITPSMVPPKTTGWQKTIRVTAGKKQDALHATIIGNLFHAAMQQLALRPNDKPGRERLELLASGPEIGVIHTDMRAQLVNQVERLLVLFYDSKLWELLSTATRVFPEVNYTTLESSASFDKRPDLILQDASGSWQIVDFKTDKLKQEEVEQKINEHADQVLRYVKDFQTLTGIKSTGWLYFAELAILEQVKAAGYSVNKSGQLQLPLGR